MALLYVDMLSYFEGCRLYLSQFVALCYVKQYFHIDISELKHTVYLHMTRLLQIYINI